MEAVLLAAAVLGTPAELEAPVQLRWESPPGCPDRAAVMEQIERFVPMEHREGAAPLHAEGTLVADGRGWSLDLVVRGEGSHMERTLRGDDCRVLASAAALVVAVMVEPAGVLEEVESVGTPEPARAPPAPELDVNTASATSEPRAAPGGFLAARGLLSWGGAPGIGAAVAVGGGLRFPRWRIGLEALLDVPRRATLADVDAGARIGLAAAALRGCYTPGAGRIEVPLCAGFDAGAMWGRGFGLAQAKQAVAPWGAFVLGTGLAIVLHRRVALRIDAEGVVSLRRPRFVVEDRGALHRPAPVGARAGAALELRLP
jgi:hypothetical protein